MFEVYQGNAKSLGEPRLWYWRYRARNGKIMADGSEGYDSKGNVKRALRRFRCLAPFARVIEVD